MRWLSTILQICLIALTWGAMVVGGLGLDALVRNGSISYTQAEWLFVGVTVGSVGLGLGIARLCSVLLEQRVRHKRSILLRERARHKRWIILRERRARHTSKEREGSI